MTAAAEGTVVDLLPEPPTVELAGRRFHVRPQGVSLLGLMKFATIAKHGIRDDDPEGLSAVYELLTTCIADDEWQAFEEHANRVGADGTDLQQVIAQAVQGSQRLREGGARPTQPVSGSPGGQPPTAASSAAGSSSPVSSDPIRMGDVRVQRRLEAQGRPDLALVVLQAREASTGSSRR